MLQLNSFGQFKAKISHRNIFLFESKVNFLKMSSNRSFTQMGVLSFVENLFPLNLKPDGGWNPMGSINFSNFLKISNFSNAYLCLFHPLFKFFVTKFSNFSFAYLCLFLPSDFSYFWKFSNFSFAYLCLYLTMIQSFH